MSDDLMAQSCITCCWMLLGLQKGCPCTSAWPLYLV